MRVPRSFGEVEDDAKHSTVSNRIGHLEISRTPRLTQACKEWILRSNVNNRGLPARTNFLGWFQYDGGAVFLLACHVVPGSWLRAGRRRGDASSDGCGAARRIRRVQCVEEFDLPAQPLALALERYSVASGWQIIYDSNLATGLRSAGVRGNLPPSAALRMLLAGTGLVPQYMAADGVMLGYGGGGDDTPNQDPQNPDSRGKKRDQQSYDPDSAVHLLGNGQLTEEQKKSLSDEEKSKLDRLVGQRSSLQ